MGSSLGIVGTVVRDTIFAVPVRQESVHGKV
jgi:hypothetical protein